MVVVILKVLSMHMYAEFHQFVHSGWSFPLLNGTNIKESIIPCSHTLCALYGRIKEGKWGM